ncbi:MAG: DUF1501 domain-containing protein [Actinobacteria bacterium]|uniref:Unannotated protein n=1 Tax=freshwater metagenome TaxID=449393 RepID=A0A6J6QJQ1_9ZZZZ|nr:DUF1501 domain-containing protein [Actinomycetota bacterium]
MTDHDATAHCCAEMHASRRGVLQGTALFGAAAAIGSTVVTMAPASPAAAATQPAPWTIVVLSLRGAADGLSLVVPHADPAYYTARPRIAVPRDQLLRADAMFGLHPAMKPLEPMWAAGRLATVHATGLPVANRSHFSAMEEVEDAAPGSTLRTGWLNRLLGTDAYTSPLQGLSIGTRPSAMYGPEQTMATSSSTSVRVAGASALNSSDKRFASLTQAWSASSTSMGRGMQAALGAVADYAPVLAVADTTSSYPSNDLGRALATVARTIKGNVGSAVFTVDHGNWDMHQSLGTSTSGWMFNNVTTLATSIAAFFTDLGPAAGKVTLVTISEFGRRVVENDSSGLDHGWGNVMMLAGAGVKGGKYYGIWPGLATTSDADLSVTTDYRSVLAEVVASRTGASTATVFPGFTRERVGVMSGQ